MTNFKRHSYSIPYERLDSLIEKNGLTAYRVAKDTGVSQVTLSNWKSGLYYPKLEKLGLLADYFKVRIDYFIVRK